MVRKKPFKIGIQKYHVPKVQAGRKFLVENPPTQPTGEPGILERFPASSNSVGSLAEAW